MEIWFGKHEGKQVSEIPTGYLRWLVEEFDPSPHPRELRGAPRGFDKHLMEQKRDLVAAAEDELIERGEE